MHIGRDATYSYFSHDFFWKNKSKKNVKNWVRKFPKCLRFKTLDQMKIIVYKYPFHKIGIDFVKEFPFSSSGNRWILTIRCPYSNYLKAVPIKDKKATTAAKVLFEQVFLQFGFPSVLLSDRGGEWLNAVFQQLLKLLSIDHICTASYRPRLNGSTERIHRWLNTSLGIFCEKYQESWEDYLQAPAYVHNNTHCRHRQNRPISLGIWQTSSIS